MCNNRKEKYTDSLCLAWQCVMWLGEGMFGSIVWLLLNLDTEELCTTSLTVRSRITDIQLNWLTLTRRNFNRAHDIFFQLKNTHLFPKEKIQSLLYPNPQSRIFFFFWLHGTQIYTLNVVMKLLQFSQHTRVSGMLALNTLSRFD